MADEEATDTFEVPSAFILPRETLEATLQYLATRPWAEVNEAMVVLQNLEPYKP